jgi:hypothetical protein
LESLDGSIQLTMKKISSCLVIWTRVEFETEGIIDGVEVVLNRRSKFAFGDKVETFLIDKGGAGSIDG